MPYSERRAILDDLLLAELGVATTPVFPFADAPALFRACAAHGVEGLVLKAVGAPPARQAHD
jgi:ATP-dependent DNA ligase